MSSFAIVVGINDYPPNASQKPLSGAVNDAADFADWALDPNGGNVPANKLYYWICAAPPTAIGPNLAALGAPAQWRNGVLFDPVFTRPPTVAEIMQTAVYAAEQAASEKFEHGTDSRLFIFFAGHGVQGAIFGQREPQTCFLAGDFQSTGAISGLVPTESLRIGMLASGFSEVFMFLDCCRLSLTRSSANVQDLNFDSAPFPASARWVAGHASERQGIAWETPRALPTRGAFSKVVIEGLRSIRDPGTGALTVRMLEDYVASRIGPTVAPDIQEPYFLSEPGATKQVLTSGAKIPIPGIDIVIDRGAIAASETIILKDKTGAALLTFSGTGLPVVTSQQVGLYLLEYGGTKLPVFHQGPEATHVKL